MGRQRMGPRGLLRPWEQRLAVVTIVIGTMAGPIGAAAVLAASVAPSGDPTRATAPASAVALAILSLAILAWVVVAARRHRHRSLDTDEATIALPASRPQISDLDLDLMVSGARTEPGRVHDGRGSQADDRSPEHPGPATPRTAGAPVWVRRLDERIPIMPTHRNVPVDNDRPAGRPGRASARRSRGRGTS